MHTESMEHVDASAPYGEARWEDLDATVREGAQRLGWQDLMPVQRRVLPALVAGRDVMVQSKTGSGKTGAFLLPMGGMVRRDGGVQALVLTPTRELAVQVCRDAATLLANVGLRPVAIYGGVGFRPQVEALESGAQVVVGTPGRILDHLLRGTLHLDALRLLVLDEADRMLSMGFYPDMKQLQRYLPSGLQTAMFSATYPGYVQRLAAQFLKDPVCISLSQDQVHVHDIVHVQYRVPALQKSRALVKLIEMENPLSAIIFCNTKSDVHFVSVVLQRFGYETGELSADISQSAREAVLEDLRRGRIKFLVATDVAGRGIDVPDLSHVFQYQPPQDPEAYVHRTGRTGRAGAAGVAISLVSGVEELDLAAIGRRFGITIEDRPLPSDAEVQATVAQRAVSLLEAALRRADNIQKERLQRFEPLVADLAESEDGRILLAMLVDQFYQSVFHAVELPAAGPLLAASIQPAPVRASDGSNESPQDTPAREKRRRRRPRKKKAPMASAAQAVPGEGLPLSGVAGDDTVVDLVGVERVVLMAAQPPQVAPEPLAQSEGEVSDAEAGAADAALETKPKSRRRRRRPRKSGAAKPAQTSGPEGAEQDSPLPAAAMDPLEEPTRASRRRKIFLE